MPACVFYDHEDNEGDSGQTEDNDDYEKSIK